MKTLSAPLLLALSLCLIPAINAADTKPATTPAPKAAPAPVAKAAEAKAEEAKPITGALVPRTNGSGGFLNLKVDNGSFVLVFLDQDKKEVEADVVRGVIRYRRHLRNNQFILRRSEDGKSLRSIGAPVTRPYIFPALPVILFKEGEEGVAESYVVPFNQPMAGDGEGIPADTMTPEQLQKAKK